MMNSNFRSFDDSDNRTDIDSKNDRNSAYHNDDYNYDYETSHNELSQAENNYTANLVRPFHLDKRVVVGAGVFPSEPSFEEIRRREEELQEALEEQERLEQLDNFASQETRVIELAQDTRALPGTGVRSGTRIRNGIQDTRVLPEKHESDNSLSNQVEQGASVDEAHDENDGQAWQSDPYWQNTQSEEQEKYDEQNEYEELDNLEIYAWHDSQELGARQDNDSEIQTLRKTQDDSKFSGKKSAYGSKVSYVTRLFDEDLANGREEQRIPSVDNEKVYLPRFCLTSVYPKSGASLIYAGLLAAYRIYFREKEAKENFQSNDETYVSPFVLSPFVKNNRFIRFVSAKKQVEIDSWLLDKETLSWILCKNSSDAKLAIIDADKCIFETALYGQAQKLDEGSGRSPALASADHFARQANCSLVLVLDASESIAQLVPIMKGQMSYARPTLISGLILNKVKENNYREYKEFLERELNLPVLGYLPYDTDLENLEEDYYSLNRENKYQYSQRIQKLAETILRNIDLDTLYSMAEKASTLNSYISQALFQVQKKLGSEKLDINIAYTRDDAFDNAGIENLYLLSELGVNLIPISPLNDEELREDIDGLYLSSSNILPFRKELSDNRKFNKSIQYAAKRGLPIFAEEEAYLYICNGFTLSYENVFWPMCSLSTMRLEIDEDIDREQYEYISMTNAVNNPIASIHWTIKSVIKSYLLHADSGNAMKVRRERNRQTCHMAYASSNVFATASKISFVSEPRTLLRFVSACLNYRDEKFSKYDEEVNY